MSDNNIGKINGCSFYNIHQTGDGGAIKIISDSAEPEIIYCTFNTISIDGSGGSIYLSTKDGKIQHSSFYKTYSTKHNNDVIVGNAVCSKMTTIFNHNYVSMCGYIENKCCDSSIRFNKKSTITNYNASRNRGISGGSGFSLRTAPESTVEYVNIVDSLDSNAFENNELENIFSYINVINSTRCARAIIFLTADNVLTLKHCIFINCHNDFALTKTKINFIQCVSDKTEMYSITYDKQPKTHFIAIQLKTININTCRSRLIFNIKYLALIFLIKAK